MLQEASAASPCGTCLPLSCGTALSVTSSSLSSSPRSCELCELLLQCFKDASVPDGKPVRVTRTGSVLQVHWSSKPSLSLQVAPSTSTPQRSPSGFPILYGERSEARLALFRHWVRTCEDHSEKCGPTESELPTRVIDVGKRGNREALRLYTPHEGEMGSYIALSHRWTRDNFCTHPCNFSARLGTGIGFSSLPARFQDAVIVTQELGVKYLWIDSICIIQKHTSPRSTCPQECNGEADWLREGSKMENYFGSAYCTLAAVSSAADHTDRGFLDRHQPLRWIKSAQVPRNHVPVSDDINNFHRDVEKSELNKRGWVLQERALSRRTIHFTATQAYWECGCKGILCETGTKLEK